MYYYIATSEISTSGPHRRRGIAYFFGCILGFFYHIYNAICGRNKRYVYDRVEGDEDQELKSMYRLPKNMKNVQNDKNDKDVNSVALDEGNKDATTANNNTSGGGNKKKKREMKNTATSSKDKK